VDWINLEARVEAEADNPDGKTNWIQNESTPPPDIATRGAPEYQAD
jgi:hypothetical protein